MGSRHRNIRVFEFQDSWIPTFILLWRISRNDNMERVPVIPAKAGIQKKAPPTRQGLSDMSELTTEPKKGFYSSLVTRYFLLITRHL